jgi:hypothetical protein
VLALLVSVGSKLLTLILSITAVSLFGYLLFSTTKELLKAFSELNPNLFQAFLLTFVRFCSQSCSLARFKPFPLLTKILVHSKPRLKCTHKKEGNFYKDYSLKLLVFHRQIVYGFSITVLVKMTIFVTFPSSRFTSTPARPDVSFCSVTSALVAFVVT